MTVNSKNPAFITGQLHADLFLGFITFLFDNCQQRGIEDLFFCTREGVFFKALFDSVFKRSPEFSTVRTHVLEASRLSVFPATVIGENELELSGLFRLYKRQSPTTLLKSLGLDFENYADLFARYNLDPNLLEKEFEFMNRLQGFLADHEFKERTYPKLRNHKSAVLGYLSQCFAGCQRIGFVDIGWRGTIQNSIATLMSERQFIGLYMGLAFERNIMRPNCEKIAYGPNQNNSREYVDLLHAVNVLEFVCLSTGGSASGYAQNTTGQFAANMSIDAQENLCIEEFSIPFQQGVLSAVCKAEPQELIAAHQGGRLREIAMEQWSNIIRKPPQELVDAYFSLKSNEVFGRGMMADQAITPSLWHSLTALVSQNRRLQLIRFLTYNQWAEGYLMRRDVNRYYRWLIYALMRLATLYKFLKF